ncbi:MAG: hypothetical protein ACJAZ2_002375 [Glaciecola sp.]|jgi:hypothetical protein
MNRKLLLILTANMLLIFPLLASSDTTKIHITNGYQITYPYNWSSDTSKAMGTDLILFSPTVKGISAFRSNVNILVQDLSAYDLTLDQYVKISVNQIETLITDSKILLNKRTNGTSGPFQKMIYTGKQGKLNLKFEQYYWLVNKKAYVLTLTCDVNNFSKYQQAGEQILNSFKLK